MKSINTLVKDIYEVVAQEGWFNPARLADFSAALSVSLNQTRGVPSLRLSKLGEHCPSQLWHSVHSVGMEEPVEPWARIKFTYGYITEALVLELAKAAGHTVTGEQDELILDGVKGHRDCVIDGCIVDVKSINSLGFQKVKSGLVATDIFLRDYLDQLDGYVVASHEDPLVQVKDRGYILFIDKVLGHLKLYEHRVRPESIRNRIQQYQRIVGLRSPPRCTCGTGPDGKSGNIKLDVKASYNPYKYCCNPTVRKFLYAGGPIYLTKVVRLPDVTEVDRLGNIVVH
jgi:hypothetical protein